LTSQNTNIEKDRFIYSNDRISCRSMPTRAVRLPAIAAQVVPAFLSPRM
jgi:hypothetical protein